MNSDPRVPCDRCHAAPATTIHRDWTTGHSEVLCTACAYDHIHDTETDQP